IGGATSRSLSLTNVRLDSQGNFQVGITNCAGSITRAVATLTVTPVAGISFDFNTPGQFTNAPYNLVGNDWINNQLPKPPVAPFDPVVAFEVSTGGVGVATGGGGLDLMFNQGNDQSFTFLPLTYDFSLP